MRCCDDRWNPSGGVFGDVHHPQTVRLSRVKGSVDQIVGRLGAEISPRAASPTAPVDAGDTRLAHQALHPFARAADVLAESQLGKDPGDP